MSDVPDSARIAYVDAAARLTQMPLSGERLGAVAAVMARIETFAFEMIAFELADDIEIAGIFTP